MNKTKIGALQIGNSSVSTKETVLKILSFEKEIKAQECELIVLPEAILGGYPKGWDFGTRIGYRTDEGREQFLQYWNQAIDIEGSELKEMKQLAKRAKTSLVIGIIEKIKSSLYCSTVFINETGALINIHRKLMPTASERLIWAQGDGSTMPVLETSKLRAATAICWENYMPLMRSHLYSQNLNLWCASTVDDREIWQVSMRHIAYEGRMFLCSAAQYLDSPKNVNFNTDWPEDKPLIRGGSVIISPMGEIIAGPIYDKEALLTAEIDLDEVIKARYDMDASGHYSRPDIFKLTTNTEERIDS